VQDLAEARASRDEAISAVGTVRSHRKGGSVSTAPTSIAAHLDSLEAGVASVARSLDRLDQLIAGCHAAADEMEKRVEAIEEATP
jgi:hypothetical protein